VGLSVPATVTVGKELPLNQLVELLRVECAMCGFTEILTWALCSRSENFEYLRRQDDGNTAVSIGNPATAEFEVCRTSLLQGMPPGSSRTCCLQLCTKWSAGAVLIVSFQGMHSSKLLLLIPTTSKFLHSHTKAAASTRLSTNALLTHET